MRPASAAAHRPSPDEADMKHTRTLDPELRPVAMPDGRLDVLRRDGPDGAATVALRLRHRSDLAGVLVGRSAGEVPGLIRRALPLGGWTERVVGLSAVEAASGRIPDPAAARARALLVQAEVAVGLVAQACLDWPGLLGAEPRLRHLRYARTALDALTARIWRGGDPADPATRAGDLCEAELAVSALIEAIETTVLPLAPADPAGLAGWAQRSGALLARLVRAGAGIRVSARVPAAGSLPALPALAAAMADEPRLAQAPHLSGAAGDPTPFTRMPPIPEAERFGLVGARLLARAALAQATVESLARLDPPAVQTAAPAPGSGAALVEGLHGPIVCRVHCDRRARITAVASVPPAAWLVHPAGPLAAMLAALPQDRFLADAPFVLAAFDPCGAVKLRQDQDASA
jgi:hypothetical protein